MNNRIKQLAEQAGLLPKEIGPVVETRHMKKKQQDLEKFAELIVRECIDWCNAHARDDGTAQRIAEDIKKDFGVKNEKRTD